MPSPLPTFTVILFSYFYYDFIAFLARNIMGQQIELFVSCLLSYSKRFCQLYKFYN